MSQYCLLGCSSIFESHSPISINRTSSLVEVEVAEAISDVIVFFLHINFSLAAHIFLNDIFPWNIFEMWEGRKTFWRIYYLVRDRIFTYNPWLIREVHEHHIWSLRISQEILKIKILFLPNQVFHTKKSNYISFVSAIPVLRKVVHPIHPNQFSKRNCLNLMNLNE